MENKKKQSLHPLTDKELQQANGGAPPGSLPPGGYNQLLCSKKDEEACKALSDKCYWDSSESQCVGK